MIKLSDKSRRVLRKIYKGLAVTVAPLLFQTCFIETETPVEYGPGPDIGDDILIHGSVCSAANIPIPGIKVSVGSSAYFTNEYGNFRIYMPKQESYELQFEDVDGPENGSYKTQTKTISLDVAYNWLNVQLDEEDEADEADEE